MPTPFVCRKCTARLVRFAFGLPRPHLALLHTQVIRGESPPPAGIPPTRHDRPQQLEPSQSRHSPEITEWIGRAAATAAPTASPSSSQGQGQHGTTGNVMCWDCELKEFVLKLVVSRIPVPRQPAGLPHGEKLSTLKARILGVSEKTRKKYLRFHGDLLRRYTLATSEARHAVDQLQRLLCHHLEYASAARELDRYFSWKKAFSSALRDMAPTSFVQEDRPSTSNVRSKVTPDEGDTASMRTAWLRLDEDAQERSWPQMILNAFKSDPHMLPTLIESTFNPSRCPSYVVEDLLYLVFRRHRLELRKGTSPDSAQTHLEFKAIVAFLLNNCPPKYLSLEQVVLHSFLSRLPTSQLFPHYQLLQSIEHPLHANTLLHVASRFAKRFDKKILAVDILRLLTDMPGFDINTPSAASVCTSLLTLDENEPLPNEEEALPDVLFEFLVERGFRPNLLGLSALMRNFCIRGHLDTAWKVFDLMLQYGLQPDPYVYSILLNGSKQSLDLASIEQIFHIITSNYAWSPILLTDFLGIISSKFETHSELGRRQRKANSAWPHMLKLYDKFFYRAPLQKLITLPLICWFVRKKVPPNRGLTPTTMLAKSMERRPEDQLLQPDTLTLCLMMGACIRSLPNSELVAQYYMHFQRLVDRKDPTALSILKEQGTWVADIFLRAFLQFRESIDFAMHMLQKMIENADREEGQIGIHLLHRPPTARTWTIVLSGLKNHRKASAVEAAFKLMNSICLSRPSLPTWTALIQAFAQDGNVEGLVKAIWVLEKAGLKPDDRVARAFEILPSILRERAVVRLEAMRKVPEMSDKELFSYALFKGNAKPARHTSSDVLSGSVSSLPKTLDFNSPEPGTPKALDELDGWPQHPTAPETVERLDQGSELQTASQAPTDPEQWAQLQFPPKIRKKRNRGAKVPSPRQAAVEPDRGAELETVPKTLEELDRWAELQVTTKHSGKASF
ncbi:hypothetical protein F4802DRAFT_552784 [Xylaria palmicola]|nr:hypothetical protein F4802DRAFT_552784 [Xylaria palmicola]